MRTVLGSVDLQQFAGISPCIMRLLGVVGPIEAYQGIVGLIRFGDACSGVAMVDVGSPIIVGLWGLGISLSPEH